jgi:putative spermidine/putrescine transport system permease protein
VRRATRPPMFYGVAVLFALFVVFLYGPIAIIVVLAFQGPEGGLVFPMNGVSLHWFGELFRPQSIGDIWGAFDRSIRLGTIVMVTTVLISLLAGLAYRCRFPGATVLFYIVVASLVMPSIVVSLGIGAMFEMLGIERVWYGSALGAHLTWTLPFGLLIMLAVFDRFNPAYEEAARDLGATGWQTVRYAVVPIIAPSLVGVALFGFTLSYDEIARTSQSVGTRGRCARRRKHCAPRGSRLSPSVSSSRISTPRMNRERATSYGRSTRIASLAPRPRWRRNSGSSNGLPRRCSTPLSDRAYAITSAGSSTA